MTLAVGKVTKSGLVLLSDTRQYEPSADRSKRSVRSGTMKTTILWETIAVSFTGNVDVAQRDVAALQSNGENPGVFAVIEFFEQRSNQSRNDYLVAFAQPGKLYKIADGKAESMHTAWVGHIDGFERFQVGKPAFPDNPFWEMSMFGPDVPDSQQVSDRITRMSAVVEDPSVDSVGDFFTLVAAVDGKFRVCFQAGGYFDAEARLLDPLGRPLLSSTGENRAYRFFAWAPKDRSLAAAAFIFPDPQAAFVFTQRGGVGFADQTHAFYGLTTDELVEKIAETTGVVFETLEFWHLGTPRP
ncbi:hypothetical protein LPB73_07675 [Tardiphaga sp. 37S4]|uniref:hypothetical protein n=1 Tax=Tardiphaga sp. 37S4 TaxID=1404741 RepID=UPI001E35154A|nr:hypothetical protein [Tardiphaga sp. 37S4]UFS77247.1 hypothetical protein LPB73_07675 [Tardiphaga sp. 37S4]